MPIWIYPHPSGDPMTSITLELKSDKSIWHPRLSSPPCLPVPLLLSPVRQPWRFPSWTGSRALCSAPCFPVAIFKFLIRFEQGSVFVLGPEPHKLCSCPCSWGGALTTQHSAQASLSGMSFLSPSQPAFTSQNKYFFPKKPSQSCKLPEPSP